MINVNIYFQVSQGESRFFISDSSLLLNQTIAQDQAQQTIKGLTIQISYSDQGLIQDFFQGVHMESEVKLERKCAVNWGASDTF